MPKGLDIADAFAARLAADAMSPRACKPATIMMTITTMRPSGPGRTRAS